MSRLARRFEQLKAQDKTALIPYVAAGDPQLSITVPLLHRMVASGANVLELGVPFSDPNADGPTIQASMERALAQQVSLLKVLDMVAEFREQDTETPLVLMGYLNPVEKMGYQVFADAAAQAGVDAVLTVDLPPEEAGDFVAVMKSCQLDCIFLVAPTSTAARIAKIAEYGSGFLYYVSLKGVTGSSKLDVEAVERKLHIIRKISALPLCVGFGIKDAVSASAVAKVADGVVVGSALVKKMAANVTSTELIMQEVGDVLLDMRKEMDAV